MRFQPVAGQASPHSYCFIIGIVINHESPYSLLFASYITSMGKPPQVYAATPGPGRPRRDSEPEILDLELLEAGVLGQAQLGWSGPWLSCVRTPADLVSSLIYLQSGEYAGGARP